MPKRFELDQSAEFDGAQYWAGMEEDEDGEWVLYEDFCRLSNRIEELEAKLGVFADDSNWFDVHDEDGQAYAAWRGPSNAPEEFARAALEEPKGEL